MSEPARRKAGPGTDRRAGTVGDLHVFALASLVFAQPLFDLLARNAEFFVVRRSSGGDLVALALALLVVLPLPLVGVTALAKRISPRLGLGVHLAVMAALAALFVLLALTRTALLDGVPWLVAGLLGGLAFAWAYHRFGALRLLSSYLAAALVAVPALFFSHPQIRKITFSQASADLHESGARTPIVFLLFDELSLSALLDETGGIDARSYPNLAAFAGEATWFADTATASDATELAVPAILTADRPRRDRLPILEDHPHNLFTIFGGDYRIWASEPITRLCPPGVNVAAGGRRPPDFEALLSDLWIVYQHLLLPPRFSGHLPVISDRWQDFGRPAPAPEKGPGEAARPTASDFSHAALVALGRDRRAELDRFLAAIDPDVDSALYFLHVLLPHTPWEYLPSGKAYAPQTDRIPGLEDENWQEEEAFVVQAYQRYLLQVRFLDRWLGELIAHLRRLGLYDRSLITFVADHGVSFRPGDSRRFMTETNWADLVAVPFFVKAPGQRRGRVVERPVSTLDVVPTILDLLDVETPWPLEGRSALAQGRGDPRRPVVGKYLDLELDEGLDRRSDATLEWKLETFGTDRPLLRAGTRPELYGRRADELGWRRQDAVKLHLKGASLFQRHDGDDAFSPSFISGVLETSRGDAECCELAVAVGGVVYATVRTFGSPPADLQFTALVPDDAFAEGENRVEVFRIRPGGEQIELERLGASADPAFVLVEGSEGEIVAVRQGERVLPVRAGALRGYFSTERLTGQLRISGWAVDLERRAAPEQILVFYRGEMVYSGLTTLVRSDVEARLGWSEGVRSAFQFRLPANRAPQARRWGLRLIAVSNQAATELGWFYTLETDGEGRPTRIVLSNAREIPVVAGALEGAVDWVRRDGSKARLHGWAADVVRGELAERILVFAGTTAVYDSRTYVARQDVVDFYGVPEILHSGFEYDVELPPSADEATELMALAVARQGQAVRLLPPVYPPAGEDGGRAK